MGLFILHSPRSFSLIDVDFILMVISKQFIDNLEFELLISFLLVKSLNSDHPNTVLIAYGPFRSPFQTSDCMNASGAFASINIVM